MDSHEKTNRRSFAYQTLNTIQRTDTAGDTDYMAYRIVRGGQIDHCS
jgi:hypothetical protein